MLSEGSKATSVPVSICSNRVRRCRRENRNRKQPIHVVVMARRSDGIRLAGQARVAASVAAHRQVEEKKKSLPHEVTGSGGTSHEHKSAEVPAHPPKLRRGGASWGRRRRGRLSSSRLSRGGLGLGSAGGQPHRADHDESNYRLHWILLFLEGSAHLARSGMVCRPFRTVKSRSDESL